MCRLFGLFADSKAEKKKDNKAKNGDGRIKELGWEEIGTRDVYN